MNEHQAHHPRDRRPEPPQAGALLHGMPQRVSTLLARSIERAGQALALINGPGDRVLWHSQAFSALLDTHGPGSGSASWSAWLSEEPALARIALPAAQRALCSGEIQRAPLEATACRQSLLVDIEPLDAVHYVCRLQSPVAPVADLRRFLRAHDGLFSTSRSISVSEMATALAHEINQPLGTIVNLLRGVDRRLRRDTKADEAILKAIDNALEQAQFSAQVISRIRDFTHQRRPLQNVLDCGEILDQALVLLQWMIDAGHCRLRVERDADALPVIGDATMLQQVIVNLIRNAVEAMHETPIDQRLLRVRLRRDSAQVRLSVHDNGHGITGSDAELFVPFASSKPSGMGVGLNICRSFIELHQGRLWLVPGEEGGCTAELSLPLQSCTAQETAPDGFGPSRL